MDNVNIYRGNKQHHRLFKTYGENMWNFTVRGLLIPRLGNIEDLFAMKETATQSQSDVTEYKYDNISIENNPEHLEIWNSHKDNYLVELLKDGLCLHTDTGKELKYMSETECNWCLSKDAFHITDDLKLVSKSNCDTSLSGMKSNTTILPSFDSNSNSFSLKKARNHTEFILMRNYHKEQRMQYDHHLSSVEKEGDVIPDESNEDESNDDDNFVKDEENDEGQPSNGQ